MFRNTFKSAGIIARILVLLSIMLLAGANMGCHRDDYVVYEVTGDADEVDILMTTDTGSDGKYKDVPLPWRMEFGGFDSSNVTCMHIITGIAAASTEPYISMDRIFRQAASSRPYDTVVVFGEKNN